LRGVLAAVALSEYEVVNNEAAAKPRNRESPHGSANDEKPH
jgi:hypothetical protein